MSASPSLSMEDDKRPDTPQDFDWDPKCVPQFAEPTPKHQKTVDPENKSTKPQSKWKQPMIQMLNLKLKLFPNQWKECFTAATNEKTGADDHAIFLMGLWMYIMNKEPIEAGKLFALGRSVHHCPSTWMCAFILLQVGEIDLAFNICNEMIHFHPCNPDAHFLMGVMKMAMEEPSLAKLNFEMARHCRQMYPTGLEPLFEWVQRLRGADTCFNV